VASQPPDDHGDQWLPSVADLWCSQASLIEHGRCIITEPTDSWFVRMGGRVLSPRKGVRVA